MNNITPIMMLMACSFLLAACSATNKTMPFAPEPADSDQAVVHIYRPLEMANALYSPGINVDGEFRFYAKTGVQSRISLTPGEHTFEFQSEKKYYEMTPLSLKLEAGTSYFVRINTSLKINSASNYENYQRSFQLTQIVEPQALQEIAECCTKNNKTTDKKTNSTSSENKKDGFSVDKTQNPFSH